MTVLVTGGAGFIGRWVVKKLLSENHEVVVLDDLSNGRLPNLDEFRDNKLLNVVIGDIKDNSVLNRIFTPDVGLCIHLGASIIVQDSIDDPRKTFENDVIGTFNVLEKARAYNSKLVFMSTCMVYDAALKSGKIDESSETKAASPYAGAKLAGENLVISYYYAYDLPVVILRPFNTYGPYQKSSGEGGVVPIFIQKTLRGEDLIIYGDGTQTRDLLYVEDCADFVVNAAMSDSANGEIINAGTGQDIAINDLAMMICKDSSMIKHVEHIHPQSEISKLVCDSSKAEKLLDWKAKTSLQSGIEKTTEFFIKMNE